MKLEQPAANRDAIGAWIEVRCEGAWSCAARSPSAAVTPAASSAGGISDWATSRRADVRVIWPDGTIGDWQPVDGNNFYILERGKPAQLWIAK